MKYRCLVGFFCLFSSRLFAWEITDGVEPGDAPPNFWGGNYEAKRTTEKALTGNYSLRFHFAGVPIEEDGMSELRFYLPGPASELFISYDLYIPENYYHRDTGYGSMNNKSLFQLWSGNYGAVASNVFIGVEQWPTLPGSGEATGDSFPSIRMGSNGDDLGHTYGSRLDFGEGEHIMRVQDRGTWQNYSAYVKLSDQDNANGIVEIYRNGELVVRKTNIDNYSQRGNFLDRGYLLGWSNSGYTEDTVFYVDNFSISNEDGRLPPPNAPSQLNVTLE